MIFNSKVLRNKLHNVKLEDIPNWENKINKIGKWKFSIENSDLNKTKEKQLQGKFLLDFFCDILDYKNQIGRRDWTFIQEEKTIADTTTPDGVLGYFSSTFKDIRVVIELKDATTNLDAKQKGRDSKLSPVEQAFSYTYKYDGKCKWVIVSNFKEIRFYSSTTMLEYEKFEVSKLVDKEEFKKFYYLLNENNLINPSLDSVIDNLYLSNIEQYKNISKQFYKEYKETRLRLFNGIKVNNPSVDELVIFEKAQKLMDRFIFICFCEDKELLPTNTFKNVLNNARNSFDPSNNRVWQQLKGLFIAIDKGNPSMNINRFNGGLFAKDLVLDNLYVPDELFKDLESIAEYDFETDLNVNILGHIFEQSIGDIEEIKAEIKGEIIEKKDSKRKKDGIYYTPDYIVNYIVEECIGTWLEEQRKKLGEDRLPDIPEGDGKPLINIPKPKGKRRKKLTPREAALEEHRVFWVKYGEILSNVKILDPACGSGAFLNAAFDYLLKEGQRVNEEHFKITNTSSLFDLDKNILKNNLYGVDLNTESVEITKLSLWLKTANKREPLTSLDKNILCGNSIINDKNYDLDKSFNWSEGFKEIINNGGFDIIIGNPPYVRQEIITTIKPYLKMNYKTYAGRSDLFVYFFEKGLTLLKDKGIISFICSSKYTKARYGIQLRKYILENSKIKTFIDFGDLEVFEGVIAYPSIIILEKDSSIINRNNNIIKHCYFETLDIDIPTYIKENTKLFNQKQFGSEEWIFKDDNYKDFVNELNDNLSNFTDIVGLPKAGVKTGKNSAFVIDKEQAELFIKANSRNAEIIKPYIFGEDVKPYFIDAKQYIIFPYKKENNKLEIVNIHDYVEVYNYLLQFKDVLENRAIIKDGIDNGKKVWYEYQQINKQFNLDKTYIVYPDIANKNSFAISKGNVIDMTVFWIECNDPISKLPLLNSKPLEYIFNGIAIDCRGGYKRYKNQYVTKLPFPRLNEEEREKYTNFATKLIKEIQELQKKKNSFISFLEKCYFLKNRTREIEFFYEKSFEELIQELKKQKINLTDTKAFDLMKLYDRETKEINIINNNIAMLKDDIEKCANQSFNVKLM